MNPLPYLYRFEKELTRFSYLCETARLSLLVLFLFATVEGAFAQTVTWSDSFVEGVQPTAAQCQNWTNFLDQLGQKNFVSVTLSGTYDTKGKSLTDPDAVNQLAALLNSRTPGVVTSGSDSWIVSECGTGACNGLSIALSVNGNPEGCDCLENYAVRPQAANEKWGGVNTKSCGGPSQKMTLEFSSGVSIIASGPTSFCQGGSVKLTADIEFCSSPYSYLWSNGETTESITVTESGDYFVTLSGSNGCSGTSETVTVSVSAISVAAGEDVAICEEGVQLNAVGTPENTGSSVNKICLFDAKGGYCTFTDDLCKDGYELVVDKTVSQDVTMSIPNELKFRLYYSAISVNTTFLLKLNGHQIGSFLETNDNGTCNPGPAGQYPRSFTFDQGEFKQYWKDGIANTLTVEIDSDESGIYLAGVVAEVLSSNEIYSWSPVEGLSDASVSNPFASPEVSTIYTVSYTDASGCTATDEVEVKVICNTAPVAVCKEVSVPADTNCEAVVEASEFDGGSTSPSGAVLSYSVSPAGPYPVGTTEVALTVTDTNGESSTCTTKVTVIDTTLPEIATPADLTVSNDAGACFATIDVTLPEASDNCGLESISNDHDGNIFQEGETIVTWTATDIHGNKKSTTQKVIVVNTIPVINSVEASPSPVAINSPVTLTITYTDNNINNVTIDWGDNSSLETVIEPEAVFDVSHTYSRSGSYSVTITLVDRCDGTTYSYESVVVSNPWIGSVSGGGWYHSPNGAYLNNPTASGKATFAFQVNNKNRNQIPDGYIVFNFHEGRIKFRSRDLEWLRIEDETASIKAVGRLNGDRDYRILISVIEDEKDQDGKHRNKDYDRDYYDDNGRHGGKHDDRDDDGDDDWGDDRRHNVDDDRDHDRDDDDRDDDRHHDRDKHKGNRKGIDLIRVKIWDPSGNVIYDTQLGSPDEAIATTPLSGGSVKIKEEKTGFNQEYESPVASSFGGESSSAYPNPFTDWVDVKFNSSSREDVAIQVLDLSGKVLFNEAFPVSEDGTYPLDIPEEEKAGRGIYILVIKQGKKVEFLRLIRN